MVKWGIIGCGNVTEVKSGPAFQKIGGSELVAVMRRDGAKAKDFAARHNVPKWYTSVDDLIADKDVEAVYVATPPSSHADIAVKVMKAGKPVYVEKPMACTVDECTRMTTASKETGQKLWVAYYRRELPGFKKVAELVSSNAIGTVLSVEVTLHQHHPVENYTGPSLPWRVVPEIAGGGLFYDLASHTFDALDMILGPVETATGEAANPRKVHSAAEVVSASFRFASGAVGTGVWSFCAPPGTNKDSVVLTGTKGVISFSTFAFTPVQLLVDGTITEFPFLRPDHVQRGLIQTIVGELHGEGVCPSTGESAARTNRVLRDITGKYYTNNVE
eukprot:TRINITY_DN11444_c0_g1_i1.p1 TRINITY_DN11444_c0_g1~~TRINITY_DN11444_c0_g1_i1.p1  ORF type:complete len:351 (+),score=64.47 TRINITY_DN11444_c0_g1_i1:62-1054(+)